MLKIDPIFSTDLNFNAISTKMRIGIQIQALHSVTKETDFFLLLSFQYLKTKSKTNFVKVKATKSYKVMYERVLKGR